jgi:hypothetical protein
MLKKEFVYLFILDSYFKNRTKFTQKEISDFLVISLSTVNNALKPLEKMHAIEIKSREFILRDFEKILVYWATLRDIQKDIVYSTFYPDKPENIEALMPNEVYFTGYSGYKILEEIAPADYGEIYLYSNNLSEIKERFPKREGPKNIIVLKEENLLKKFSKNNKVPLPLIFVDLWNLPEWYAKDFLNDIKKKVI